MSTGFKDIEIVTMKLADLKPAEYNPRQISEGALTGLGKSMGQFGNMGAIVWNRRSGNIVGGHQRYKTLVEAGEKDAKVSVVDLDDNEEVALNIILNSKELRGDFTSEVVQQLKLCEARFGSMFDDVGLKDLLNTVGSVKFDDKPPAIRNKNGTDDDGGGNDEGGGGPDALIVCPECNSRWRMKDNKVVLNNAKGGVRRG